MRLERRTARPPLAEVLVGLIGLGGSGILALWLKLELPLPACRFREVTGLPCPTCGSTDLFRSLLRGDLAGAVASNPLVLAVLLVVSLWITVSVLRWAFGMPAWTLVVSRAERWSLGVLGGLTVASGWAYVVWRGG